MKKNGKGFGKLLAGIAIGTGIGVLFAPKKGSETRRDLKNKLDDMLLKVRDLDKEEVKENIERKIQEIKDELTNLDKEKVLEIAKKSAKAIKQKADELVDYAIKKGTPVLEKSANAIREKAIVVTKDVLLKLENKQNEKSLKESK